MALTITDAFNTKHHGIWREGIGQKASRLREYATVDTSAKGKLMEYTTFGSLEFDEKTSRKNPTVLDEPTIYKRVVGPRFFTKAIGYDEYDYVQLTELDLPVRNTIKELKAGAGRKIDDVMIQGFFGDNYVSDGVGYIPIPFDPNQVIAVDDNYDGSTTETNLTVGKLNDALERFRIAEVWDDNNEGSDQRIILCTASQIASLIMDPKISSIDYNNVKALVNGDIDTFLGFKFVMTQRLPVIDGIRQCLAYVKSKAQVAIWDETKFKVSVRDDVEETIQVRAKFAANALRLEEKAFVKIECRERSHMGSRALGTQAAQSYIPNDPYFKEEITELPELPVLSPVTASADLVPEINTTRTRMPKSTKAKTTRTRKDEESTEGQEG